MLILLNATEIDIFRFGLVTLLFGAFLGYVFFQANIIQFGTDQLRDMPTEKSVCFIHMYFWSHAVTYLVTIIVCSSSLVFSLHNILAHTSTVMTLEIFMSFSSIFDWDSIYYRQIKGFVS